MHNGYFLFGGKLSYVRHIFYFFSLVIINESRLENFFTL
jgi:hypothetical protein